jgi:glyceraldehyde-3-phosphate dehydrogenase/erythrose-4-phosphate dehydrogenase
MIGIFWNIRGLGQIGRIPVLVGRLRNNHVDFVGVLETNKSDFTPGLLRSLTSSTPFSWSFSQG